MDEKIDALIYEWEGGMELVSTTDIDGWYRLQEICYEHGTVSVRTATKSDLESAFGTE